jgi:pimeloyl-ACP methyl ester carboxylesterase
MTSNTASDAAETRVRARVINTAGGSAPTFALGAGDHLVVLLGLGDRMSSQLRMLDALATSGHRATLIGLPGFTGPTPPAQPLDEPELFAGWAAATFAALGVDTAHVVARGLGARIALELALLHPERVASLVLVSPSAHWLPARLGRRLARLRAPTLFVWGRRDALAPPATIELVRAWMPAARHVELDCGHFPHVERPLELQQAVESFRSELGAS